MRQRRPILLLALGGLVLAGLGLRDWPIEPRRATAFADRTLADYGLALAANGPARLRIMPFPTLSLRDVRLVGLDAGHPVLAKADGLVIAIDPWGLVPGRSAVGGVEIESASLSPDPNAWAGPVVRAREQARAGIRPPRLTLTGARIGDGAGTRDLDLDVAWPYWNGAVAVRASLTWHGVPTRLALTRLRMGDLLGGIRTPFSAEATWPGGSLALDGTAGLPKGTAGFPVLSGRARFDTTSLPETLAWIGQDAPLGPLAGQFGLDGTFETDAGSVSWPALRVASGNNVVEGAGAISFGSSGAPRLSVQATLAADRLDLGPMVGAFARLFEAESTPVALNPVTRGDLDLRLSASEGKIGPLTLQDLAASVLVREGAVEVALNRARVDDGTLKGRLVLAGGSDPAETDMKVQGSLDKLDLGGLMTEFGGARWVLGPMQGQFALESHARDVAGLLAQMSGRANVAIEGGALAGVDLADVIHRNGALAHGALARRNSRTGFERAVVALRISDGIGEITDAELQGAGVAATLRGQVSLRDQSLDMLALLSARQAGEPARSVRIAITGPWDAPTAHGLRGEADDPLPRPGEVRPGPLQVPAALGLPGEARAYSP